MELKEKYINVISALMINTVSNLFSVSADEKRKKMVDFLETIGKKSSDLDEYENEVRDIISNIKEDDQNLSKILSLHKEVIDQCIYTLKKFPSVDMKIVSKVNKDYIKSFLYNLSEISKKGEKDLTSYDRVSEKAIKLVRNIYAQSRALKEISSPYSEVSMEFIPNTKSLIEKISSLELHKTIKKEERKNIMKDIGDIYKSEVSFQKAITGVISSLLKEINKDQNSSFLSSNIDSVNQMEEMIMKKKEMDNSLHNIFSSMIEDDENIIEKMENEIFPIKIGDKDSLRFRGNPIINTIQKALSSYDSTMAKTIQKGGGDNGTYNIFTSIVISSIKKQSGDKDYKNPDLTKHIFDMMVEAGIFTRTQLESLKKYITELPEDEYVSESIMYESAESSNRVLSFDTFSSIFSSLGNALDESFKIDREKIESDIQEIARDKRDDTEMKIEKEEAISSNLAKKLRKIGITSESDDFINDQKEYRKGYNRNFMEAWIQSIEEEGNDVRFFSYDGGVYFAKSKETSLSTPLNFPKFLRDVESQDDRQNRENTVFNLIKCFSMYGGFPSRAKGENNKFEDLKSFTYNGNVFPELKGSKPLDKIGGDSGYLTSEEAIKLYEMMKDMVTSKDLDYAEFASLNNIILYSANLVYQDGGRYSPFSNKIKSLFTNEMVKKMRDDRMLTDDNSEVYLFDGKTKDSPISRDKNSSKSTLRSNLEKMIKRVEKGHSSMEDLCEILNSKDGRNLTNLRDLYKVYQVKSDSLSF
jgi:hypothetical protein